MTPIATFDWSQYYALADELAPRREESCLRTAIGRAYYYAFHLARQRIIANKFVIIGRSDSHRQVWEKFEASPDARCQQLGSLAKLLKEIRQRADYEDLYPRIEDDVPIILAAAKKFAEGLLQLQTDLPRNLGLSR